MNSPATEVPLVPPDYFLSKARFDEDKPLWHRWLCRPGRREIWLRARVLVVLPETARQGG